MDGNLPFSMRVAYVTNGFPFPLTSGYLRHYHLVGELARRGHAVTLLALAGPDHLPEHADALRPFVEDVVAFRRSARAGGGRWRRRLRSVAGGVDPAVAALASEAARRHGQAPFDVLVLSGRETLPALEALRGIPVVADLCDAASLRIRGERAYAGRVRALGLALKERRVRAVERRLVREADALLFASVRDREPLVGDDRRARARSTVVANGVDLERWRRTAPSLGGDLVVLTGAMHYPPNADAAIHLAEEILPRVRTRVPSAQLAIVGRDPTPRVRRLADVPGVTVTGSVPEVGPWLDRAAVFAAPIRFGAGIQNKVLEALAFEVPVVASTLAADGLRLEDGTLPPLDAVDDPAAFADRLVARLRSEATAPHAEGRRYVAEHFSWPAAGERLEGVLRDVVAARGDRGVEAARDAARAAAR